MKYAADFRYIAREALRSKWLIAVLTAFVASLILVTIVGDLFVGAYMEAAQAAFYREVSGTELAGIIVPYEEIA